VVIAGAVSFVVLTDELRQRLQDDARLSASGLVATHQAAGLEGLQAQISTGISTNFDDSNLYLFMDESGFARVGNFSLAAPFTGARELVAGVDFTPVSEGETLDGQSFIVHGLKIDGGWVFAGRDTNWILDTQEILFQSIAWALGISVVLAIGVSLTLARRNERRIARISGALDRVAQGDLAARSEDRDIWQDDIGRIARSQNDMLERLTLSIESLRQVSNDVAHDLRTPLMRLRSHLEPLMMHGRLPADAEAAIVAAVGDADRIVKTFNAVLRIAQIEGGQAQLGDETVDLGSVVADVLEMLSPVAEDAGHETIGTFPQSPVLIYGDREMLGQAFQNLIANAIRHMLTPGLIDVSITRLDDKIVVSICDNGPGIPESERDNVLKRFYRLERSRKSEGNGLGLSLAAAIVRLHAGALTLKDNSPGLIVQLTFPEIKQV
jgi:signal transduction histidine kinase